MKVLEVGAGVGQLAIELQEWAARRGWAWEFTCLDLNTVGIEQNPIPRKVVGDATNLPFAEGILRSGDGLPDDAPPHG